MDFFRSRRSRSQHRRSQTPPTTSAQKIEMTAAQQAQITQFLSASLSGIGQPANTVHSIAHAMSTQPEPVRTDFSNLFHSISNSSAITPAPNASALAIAAAKARDLLKARNFSEAMKGNGNSLASNGNDSTSRDGK